MTLRTLALAAMLLLAGCSAVTAEVDVTIGMEGGGDTNIVTATATPDGPVVHEVGLDRDGEWIALSHRYAVPNHGGSVAVTEQWSIRDEDGDVWYANGFNRSVEGAPGAETVTVGPAYRYVDVALSPGTYTVALVVVDRETGVASEPVRATVVVERSGVED